MYIHQLQSVIIIIVVFILVIICDLVINYFLSRSFLGKCYRFFVAPGIIVHEFSHALAASLTGNKIKKINITSPTGGYVIHTAPKSRLSQVIISFAPIIGITAIFLLLTYLFQKNWLVAIETPSFHSLRQIILNSNLNHWPTWIYLYLALSLSTSLAPSLQDIKVATPGLIIILILLILLALTPLHFILDLTTHYFTSPIIILLAFLSLAIILSLFVFAITQFFRRRR